MPPAIPKDSPGSINESDSGSFQITASVLGFPGGSAGSLPALWENHVQSLAWEDSLEKEMATHSSIPAWRIPWTEKPDGLQSMGSQRVGHD